MKYRYFYVFVDDLAKSSKRLSLRSFYSDSRYNLGTELYQGRRLIKIFVRERMSEDLAIYDPVTCESLPCVSGSYVIKSLF